MTFQPNTRARSASPALAGRLIRLSALARYGVAVVLALAGILIRLALDPVWGIRFPYITLFPVIMVSAWLGGLGPGIVTTAISGTAAEYFWIEPRGAWVAADKSELLGVLIFVVVGVVISALNEAWRRGTDAVAESEERLSVTVSSIGDALITTDDHGRVTQLNPIAAALTGWTHEDAVGRPLKDVFVIVNEQSRQPVENPVDRVLKEGAITGLANHTVLISKDGREIPVDDSAAPIKTADGSVVGVVMVFRDVSERRRVERERVVLLEKEQVARTESQRVAEELRQLQSITDTALANLDHEALIRELLTRVRAALNSDTATMLLLDPDGTHLMPAASEGLPEELGKEIRVPVGQGAAGRIAASDRGIVIDDLAEIDVISPILRARVKSMVGAPLKVGDRLIGVLHAGSASLRRFTERDARLLALAADRIAVTIDRARSHEAEQAAHREVEIASEQLQGALQAGRMGTWQYTMASGDVKWSPGLEAIHGYAPGTFPGTFEAFQKEIYPEDRDRVLRALTDAIEQRRDHQIEYRIVRADGAVRWVEGRGQLFCDAQGQPERMVGVCSDISERKFAEERFRLAVEAAPTAMLMVDQRGTVVLINALTEQLLGYARDEIVGQPMDRLVPARFRDRHPEHRASFFVAPRQRPMGADRDLYALRKDGSEVSVEIGLSPFETTEGMFVLAAVSDITERKRHAALLQEAVRARDDFLAIASHELRNPVNAVQLRLVGILRAFQRDAASLTLESVRDDVAKADVQVRRITRLIDNLLDVSRMTAGAVVLEPEDVDLREVVRTVIDDLHQEVEHRQITLRTPEEPVVGHWDRLRLEQIVTNLLSNAIKYGKEEPIEISLDADGEVARLSVTDHGIGIDEDHQRRLFMRFERAVTGQRYGGFGLGLWISRQLVDAMHGQISVESHLGQGSTFSVTVPVRPSPTASVNAVERGVSQ